jgi:hypothetical protein
VSAPRESEGSAPTGRCRHCGRATYGGATSCKARRCPGYAPLWAGDQRRKLFDNFCAFDQGTGEVVMFAVTAPGQDVLPFDRTRCAHDRGEPCSGLLGCRVLAHLADDWNRSAPRRWRDMHREAYVFTMRHLEHAWGKSRVRAGSRPLWLIGRVWEMQGRGVLHVHPVFAYGTARQKYAVHYYREALERLAPKYGFGFVSRKFRPQEAKGAAAYLSAYFCSGKKKKLALHESVMHHRMPRSIIHVSCDLTQKTGVTMRELRLRRFVWMLHVRTGIDVHAARTLAGLIAGARRGDPPPAPDSEELAHLAVALAIAGRIRGCSDEPFIDGVDDAP